ncbi:TPA: LOW QUALITY PROTEIN: hypothetical protein N0F65_006227 [Lagenidium giganteum]|uniref:Uncharacterized protein n=1 Tax=Lagenidium giganteum TaxID=4803 RepID=A0AAV2Z3K0_9STRA|nr:TPA: LOW QUALITY PROTEIN: hypothetical protein N0F65_006227 [Lagenidium giganteum]
MVPLALHVELHEYTLRTLERGLAARPRNTARACESLQAEFTANGFDQATRTVVTGAKLNLFLHEEILNRQSKRPEKNSSNQCVGVSTVELYVAAVTDLYKQQRDRAMNSNSHPRNSTIASLLTTLKREKHALDRNQFVDRGIGTLMDGYTSSRKLVAISKYHLDAIAGDSLRDRMAHLFAIHVCCKSARNLELADMFGVLLENEGYSECRALVYIINQGKTNKFSRVEFGSLFATKIRRYVLVVPWKYIFSSPTLFVPSMWYNVKLLRGKGDRTTSISYTTHYKATVKAFDALKLPTNAKPMPRVALPPAWQI